jgi:hypothetical protein
MIENTVQITIKPMMTGREPRSPDLILPKKFAIIPLKSSE